MITSPQSPEMDTPKNNKVDAISKFLTKLRKPVNYNQALIDDIGRFNLKNFREDLANSIGEALTSKFDMTLMIKVG